MRASLPRLPAALLALAAACGGPQAADTAQRVKGTQPPDLARAVPTDTLVAVTFARAMDPSTITAASFLLEANGLAIPGTVSADAASARFLPDGELPAQSELTATLTTAVKDAGGVPLPSPYRWTFTTGNALDRTLPVLLSRSPAPGATGVPSNATVTAAFSKDLDPTTVTGASFFLKQGATPVAATVAASGPIVTLAPLTPLLANTVYAATITNAVKDLIGNPIAQEASWSFTTGPSADATAPTVAATLPQDGAAGVPLNLAPQVVFSEPMSGPTITTATVKLKKGATTVNGGVTLLGNVAVFTPAAALDANASYTLTVTTGAKDVAGNALAASVEAAFATGAASDATPPTLDEVSPGANDTNVAVNRALLLRFSEPVGPASVPGNVSVKNGSAPVEGTFSYAGPAVVFQAAGGWPAGATISVAVTGGATGVKDAAGNPLAAGRSWSFPIGAGTDAAAPTVLSTSPADGANGVGPRPAVTVTFSEPMLPTTLTAANLQLAWTPSSTPLAVPADVTFTAATATITPRAALPYSTAVTATVGTGVKDAAGNALAAPRTFGFTTGPLPAVKVNELAPKVASGPAGDANGDDATGSSDDEFVELINLEAAPVDLGGWTLRTGGSPSTLADRFTFPAGTTLAAGQRAVVFGSGAPAAVPGAQVFKVGTAGGLALADSGGSIELRTAPGAAADSLTWAAAPASGASFARSPEGTGALVDHTTLSGSAGVLWSPGLAPGAAQPRLSRSGSAPAQGASGVSPSLPVVLRFNMAMLTADLTGANVRLQASPCASAAAEVSATLAVGTQPGTQATQVTLTPAARLANSTVHCAKVAGTVRSAATGAAALGAEASIEFTTGAYVAPPAVRVNEVHGRVASGAAGDASGDGVRDSSKDEFVEILNTDTVAADVGGWVLKTGTTPTAQFTFPAGTTLPAGARAVVFGGQTPTGSFGAAQVFVTAGLSLTDSPAAGTQLYVRLERGDGEPVDQVSYGPASPSALALPASGASLVRSPEGTGPLVDHATVSGSSAVLWSPGTAAVDAIPKVLPLLSTPARDATTADKTQPVKVQFNMGVNPADLTGANLKLYASPCAALANELPATVGPTTGSATQATIAPAALAGGTRYCVKVAGAVRSAAAGGATTGAEASWEFTTGP